MLGRLAVFTEIRVQGNGDVAFAQDLHERGPAVDAFYCRRLVQITEQGLLHHVHFADPFKHAWIFLVV